MDLNILFKVITTFVIPSMYWYFKVKIPAKIKSDYEKQLSELESKLNYESKKLEDVRNNIIDSSIKRQEIIFSKKLEACDELWKEVERLAPIQNLGKFLMCIKEDEFIDKFDENPNNKLFIETFGEISGVGVECENIKANEFNISLKRPYISEYLWALYLGYSLLSSIVISNYQSLKTGKDTRDLIDYKGILNLVKKVFPTKYSHLNKIDSVIIPIILTEFKDSILNEIKNIHKGNDEDSKSIETSKEIIKAIEGLLKK